MAFCCIINNIQLPCVVYLLRVQSDALAVVTLLRKFCISTGRLQELLIHVPGNVSGIVDIESWQPLL